MNEEKDAHYAFPFEIPLAKTDHVKRKMFDVSYANLSPAQKLDIYWPEKGDGPFPVIVSIHGGAFMGGDKRDVQITSMLKGLKRGYCVVGVNYRMSGEAKFPALVHDIKAVIRWIRANAELYLFDPHKIATWGGSAGGYQSLMAGVSAGVVELDDLSLGNSHQPSTVQAVVDWFGPTDFLKMDEQLSESGMAPTEEEAHNGSDSPESLLLGKQITLIPDLVRFANPETYIHPNVPPFFIQHGTKDNIVPHQQSVNFAAKVREVAGDERVTLELIEEAGHGDPKFDSAKNVKKVLDFLDLHLK
jgi:acetyl esterase/lipase